MEQEIQLNEHNKAEYPPIHTAGFNPSLNDVIIYQTEDGEIKMEVKMEKETVWLTQAQMSELFQTDRTSIVRHINNIYKSHELEPKSTCAKIAQVRTEGKRNVTRYIPFYNLDMIISVGYRVNSKRGTQFRIWANKILKDYLIKGYVINQKIQLEHYQELKDIVRILGNTLKNQEQLTSEQSKGLLAVPYEQRDPVYILEQGETICGLAGFHFSDAPNHRTEIGYWLLPAYRGKGIITHAVRYLCQWAVCKRNINRIQIRCAVENHPSNAIPKRLGFTLEGTERDGELLVSGEYVDTNVYSILKKEVESWNRKSN